MTFSLCIYLFMSICTDLTYFVNSAQINMGIQLAHQYANIMSFGYILRYEINGFYGTSIFSLLKNLIVSLVICTFHKEYIRVAICPNPYYHLLLFVCLITDIPNRVKYFIYLFLMVKKLIMFIVVLIFLREVPSYIFVHF